MQRAHSLEKILMLGKTEGKRRMEWQRWLDNITNSMDRKLRELWETVEDRVLKSMGCKESDTA